MDINAITASVIVWIVTALLGYIGGKAHEYRKAQKQEEVDRKQLEDQLKMASRSLLRDAIWSNNRRCMTNGFCSIDDKEIIEQHYIAYHAIGGNGTGTRLYQEVMALPIKND